MKYPHLVLKSGRDRSVYFKHPWIFSGAVKTLPKAETGDIIQIMDNAENLMGYAWYDAKSQITGRVFHFTNQDSEIDDAFWIEKLKRIWSWKTNLFDPSETNCYRLVHAEGDRWPGVIIDIYDNIAVVQILVQGTARIKELIGICLTDLGYEFVYFRIKEITQNQQDVKESSSWFGDEPAMPIDILENGMPMQVDVVSGQKTGMFIDQRDNRLIVKNLSEGTKVLNTFSYTGGFSLAALMGGATLVHSVDSSKPANELCEQMINKAGFSENHQAFNSDAFDFLKQMDEDYDIIILDPPAFAKSARTVENAARGYKNLNLQAFQKIKPGGLLLTFSCSQHIDREFFRKIVFGAAADSRREVSILQHLSQPIDHTINIYHPESEYLKGLLLRVE